MSFITQLRAFTRKVVSVSDEAEDRVSKFSHAQRDELESLCFMCTNAISKITLVTRKAKQLRYAEENRLQSQIVSSVEDLCASGSLNNVATFTRNMILFFQGPDNGIFDSKQTQSRKEATRNRAQQIKSSGPVTIVLWAALFPPVAWAGGAMSQDNFDFLLRSLPQSINWPPAILDTLKKLAAAPPLDEIADFREFLDGTISYFLLHVAYIGSIPESVSGFKCIQWNGPPFCESSSF